MACVCNIVNMHNILLHNVIKEVMNVDLLTQKMATVQQMFRLVVELQTIYSIITFENSLAYC